MADALREPPSTVQSWKTSGRIPAGKQPLILDRADQLGMDIQAIDVVFPLRNRPDTNPPAEAAVLSPAVAEVEAGGPIVPFDRAAEMKRSARA